MDRPGTSNQGSNLFAKYIQDIPKREAETERERGREGEQENNLELLSSASKYSWTYVKTGYSNNSSPGTASPGSSGNSQNYGQSLEDLNVDTLISNLFHVVSKDHLSRAVPNNTNFSPNDGIDVARDSSSPNRFVNLANIGAEEEQNRMQNMPAGSPNSLVINNGNLNPLRLSCSCDLHPENKKLYCLTCSRPLCGECDIPKHHSHVIVKLIEVVEDAKMQAEHVLREVKLGIMKLGEELDSAHMAIEMLEQKARQAATDVMLCMRRVITALEVREKELLAKIEKARLLKFTALNARCEGLRNGIARLSSAAEKLNESIESPAVANNPLKLLRTKDKVSAEVFHTRQSHQSLPSQEENWISYNSLESTILNAIANLGSVAVNNPGSVGDRRPLRGRGNSLQMLRRQILLPLVSIPRGRLIPTNKFPVTVRINRSPDMSAQSVTIIGDDGDVQDNLCRPWGVACDREGHIVVADRSNNRIQIYRQDGSFLRRFGEHGTGPGQFDRPAGVAVDARRRIIVADKDNHRIQILTMEGLFILSFGDKGMRCGQFNYPWDVAVNSECQIAVSDTRNHRVQLFSPEGVFLRKYGYESGPSMWKHFDSPRGVAFSPEGNVLTTDFNNHRVVIIEADFMHARFFECDCGGGAKQFLRPQGLVIDDEGNVIVADSRNHRIQVFDQSGMLKWRYGSNGKGVNEMDRPSGIALCADGRIAVVDFGNNRVLVI